MIRSSSPPIKLDSQSVDSPPNSSISLASQRNCSRVWGVAGRTQTESWSETAPSFLSLRHAETRLAVGSLGTLYESSSQVFEGPPNEPPTLGNRGYILRGLR